MIMPARVEAVNHSMMGDDDRGSFDWEEIVHEAETAEDDSSDFDPEEEEPPSDDDDLSEYVISDDDSALEDLEVGSSMLPRGQIMVFASPVKNELSEDSKALLYWRDEENGKYFSDWKIKVEAHKSDCDDCSEETVVIYNVHRLVLAMGPKKSGYFEALLQSDCYSESSDRMSTVKLPEMVAKQFPDFLDYLYAQPQEGISVINFENWESMKYLADYFLVPRLTEAVAQFIERDMEYFKPDHMEKYISEFHRDINSDMSRRILPEAVRTCAEMFQSIEVDSSLLMSIPPAMFRSIMGRLRFSAHQDDDDEQNIALHTCSLFASYFDHNIEDIEVFRFCCDQLDLGAWCSYAKDKTDDRIMDVALTWFRLIAKKGWSVENIENKGYYFEGSMERVEDELAEITNDYLRSKTPSSEMMEKIVRDVPCHVVAKAFRESLDEGRKLRARTDLIDEEESVGIVEDSDEDSD